MSLRPVIFISAVSKELQSARQSVANTLVALGYEPDWQDIFPTDSGQLLGMLRRKVDASRAVLQLVGRCYGAEPETRETEFGRVSYTQYEALHAKSRGKKVYYVFLAEDYTADPHKPEPDELRSLQQAYALGIRATGDLRHPVATSTDLENKVLRLRDDLATLRRRTLQWASLVLALLFLSAGGVVWLLRSGVETRESIQVEIAALRSAVIGYAEAQSRIKDQDPLRSPESVEDATYEKLAEALGIDPTVLREQLPGYARQLRDSADAPAYERASAAYVAKDYSAAEQFALQAADDARNASPPRTRDAITAYELAAKAAREGLRFENALEHSRAGAALADQNRDPHEWARQKSNVARSLDARGDFRAAESIYREVLGEFERILGPDADDTLSIRNNVAEELRSQRRVAEAEAEHRAVLEARTRTLGEEHRDTLSSRNNWALTLQALGRHAEAEGEHRAVLALRTRILGPDDQDTLKSRNNLANALLSLGRHAEAEEELEAALNGFRRILPPQHPDLLSGRSNLAGAYYGQAEYAKAASEYREILALRRDVLGDEHVDTIMNQNDLAAALAGQGENKAAIDMHREVLALRERVFGKDHPDVFQSCFNLALCLAKQDGNEKDETEKDENAEALELAKRAEDGYRLVPGADPESLRKAEKLRRILEATAAPR